jgi:hypothetical protein
LSLPDLSTFCPPPFFCGPDGTSRVCVTFPGGGEICAIFPGARVPDPSELINALLQSVNAALVPLTPLFLVFEVLIAVVDCIKSVEKALGQFPPDPTAITSCIPNLLAALAKILGLMPFLTVPLLVGQLLDAIICFLTGIRNQVLAIIAKIVAILAAQTRAAALPSISLQIVTNCANDDIDLAMANLNASGAPIGRIIAIVNGLMQLAGAQPNADGSGPIPDPSTIFGAEAAELVTPLDDVITVLQGIRAVLP